MSFLFLDIETMRFDPKSKKPDYHRDKIITVQFLTEYGDFYIIKGDELNDLPEYRELLESFTIVGHNLKFDCGMLKQQYGINIHSVYDTMIAELTLSGGPAPWGSFRTQEDHDKKGMKLQDLVYRYCDGERMNKGLQCSFKLGEELTAEQIDYCQKDLEYLPIIMKKQQERIEELNLESVIETEMAMIPVMVWLELSGLHYDPVKLREITAELESLEKSMRYELYAAFGTSKINLSSPKDMVKQFNMKGIPVTSISVDELANYEDPLINQYQEYRKIKHLITSFSSKLPAHRNKLTGRVHADFFQYGTKSGRLSCKYPNLQQQPSKFKKWRTIFTAEPGNKIIACDYSQIELRILGEIANELEIIKAYAANIDLHALTASKVFNIPIKEVGKDSKERSIAKTINFGLNYGMSALGLIKKLKTEAGIELTKTQAQGYIEAFKGGYLSISKYLDRISQEGIQNRILRNVAGRLLIIDTDKEEGAAGREAMNLPIQSLCADMIKEALPKIQAKLEPMGVKFINTIHDELVFECRAEQADEVAIKVKTIMEEVGNKYLKQIPCVADVSISDCWKKG
ncbi:DNA polymerase [Methanosarcina sp. UBA289]|uniref:DNA polymerase n=1 Tax=Methanosarcina sp. UBA289 TaxID=1915574 RepID=UPI0025D6A3E4|nr:DNA polymerase [Methanosarcina sp. UBA289]